MVQRILVPFSGEGSGSEELTWGQKNIWRQMLETGTPMMVGGTMPLAPGTTKQNLIHLLSFIMSRHESLRTRIQVGEDGVPKQVVADSGEIALEVIDIEETVNAADFAESVRQRFLDEPFEASTDWPVKMAIIQQNDTPVHFVAMYAHIVIDGYGFEALTRDLSNLDQETGVHLAPRQGTQPREIARQQHSPAGLRAGEASLRYWERHMMSIPAVRFRELGDQGEPRYIDATYDSRAAFLALQVLANRVQLHSGPILLAAYAVALTRITGVNPSVVRTLVSNRFRPGFAESVAVLIQPGLCVMDVANCTFEEAIVRAWRAQVSAGKHGYYDPQAFIALQGQVKQARGVEVDLNCYFNDGRRGMAIQPGGPTPTEQELREALALSTLKPGAPVRIPEMTSFLTVNLVAETINYSLRVDTHHLTASEQEDILRLMEDLLVSSAIDPLTMTNVS